MATTTSTPQAILDAVGGAENITHLTHCATRLRFELKDASVVDKATVEKIPGVMGAVPQSGDRYQIIIGGAVQSVYNDIMKLPAMAGGASSSAKSDADIKAAARAKARGKNAYVDAFFEYLSDAFRPLLPVLLGASLILALIAVLEAFEVVDTHAKVLPAWLVFTNTMWRSVFYFLPAMVAYNAAKKLDIDPWVGAAVVLALLTPEYTALKGLQQTTCTKSSVGSDLCTTEIFVGLPMKWSDYGGQVFLPLIMVPILALVYRGLKKVIPANVQMVFVPFFSFLVMVPVSAFLIGPFSLWLGNSIGSGLSWLNTTAPIVFAIFIPLLYPFLVPLGLHWPLNALQLANIAGPAHADFIQGPMGTWNFACFGATLGVLILTLRNGDKELRQTASGALAAGLFGGISEPSLYGIHLRFKRIYPLMLTGCAAGGLTIGVISWISGSPVLTSTFVFTSLLTIPVFHPTVTYAISIAVAFFVSAFMVVTFGYQSKEEKETAAEQEEAPKAEAAPAAAPAEAAPKAELVAGQEVVLTAPLNGTVVALEDVPDPVFSSGAVGKGAGIEPSDGASIKVVAPADGSVVVAPSSGHAYGLALDNGLEILIHVGIDTVNLAGKGFDVKVAKGDRVKAGQTLVVVDRAVIEEAGYKLVTPVLVTNYMNFAEVEVIASGDIETGADLVKATK